MRIAPHKRYASIRRELASLQDFLTRPLSGVFYRCSIPRYAHPSILIDGQGTRTTGGRWMPPGEEKAVSLASTDLIATAESRNREDRFQIKKSKRKARVLVPISVSLKTACDLTCLKATDTWLQLDELLEEDWEEANLAGRECLSQAVGRAAFDLHFEAILAPSTCNRAGRTLTFFPEALGKESSVEIEDKAALEQWIKKS